MYKVRQVFSSTDGSPVCPFFNAIAPRFPYPIGSSIPQLRSRALTIGAKSSHIPLNLEAKGSHIPLHVSQLPTFP